MWYFLFGLQMTEGNITYVYMLGNCKDSHHTNKT